MRYKLKPIRPLTKQELKDFNNHYVSKYLTYKNNKFYSIDSEEDGSFDAVKYLQNDFLANGNSLEEGSYIINTNEYDEIEDDTMIFAWKGSSFQETDVKTLIKEFIGKKE